MSGKYILAEDGKTPVLVPEAVIRGRWYERNGDTCRVDRTKLDDGREVSTVFLGVDHSFGSGGPPLLFETMVFGGSEKACERYATWDEAVVGHAAMVAKENKQ